MRRFVAAVLVLGVTAASVPGVEPVAVERPVMRELPPPDVLDQPPSPRDLVEARAEMQRRFREPLSHVHTAVGATRAAEALLDGAISEPDRNLKWLLLAESRRLAAKTGQAAMVDRAITVASASYAFDALHEELRSLGEIPLRGLNPPRAASLAAVAEKLALRAETDGRLELAVSAQTLAVRAWQRAGDRAAAHRAARRHDEIETARVRSR